MAGIATKKDALNASERIQAVVRAIRHLTPEEFSHFIRSIKLDMRKDANNVREWVSEQFELYKK